MIVAADWAFGGCLQAADPSWHRCYFRQRPPASGRTCSPHKVHSPVFPTLTAEFVAFQNSRSVKFMYLREQTLLVTGLRGSKLLQLLPDGQRCGAGKKYKRNGLAVRQSGLCLAGGLPGLLCSQLDTQKPMSEEENPSIRELGDIPASEFSSGGVVEVDLYPQTLPHCPWASGSDLWSCACRCRQQGAGCVQGVQDGPRHCAGGAPLCAQVPGYGAGRHEHQVHLHHHAVTHCWVTPILTHPAVNWHGPILLSRLAGSRRVLSGPWHGV